MLGLLRRLCSLLSNLLFRAARPSSVPASSGAVEEPWTNTEWDGGGDWEPFTVQVIPNDPQTQEEQEDNQAPPEVDLFSDMQPVFKKPTMIRITKREEQEVDLRKFSVQDEAFVEEEDGCGLGVWSDEMASGWEEQDGDDLVKSSREAARQQRAQERRLQQERVRAQTIRAHGLGTRLP